MRPEPVRHRPGPAREWRSGSGPGRTPVVVLEPVVLNAAAQLVEPRRLADAQEDAGLLGGGDEIGDDNGPVGEDAGVARHALSPVRCGARIGAPLGLRHRERTGREAHRRSRAGLEAGGKKNGDRRRCAGPRGGREERDGQTRSEGNGIRIEVVDPAPGRRRSASPNRSRAPGRRASARRCRSGGRGTAPARRGRGESRSSTGRRRRRASTSAASAACRRCRPGGPSWRGARTCR